MAKIKRCEHTHIDCSQNGSAHASVSKARGAGKGKGKEKHRHEDNVPPDPDNKTKYQVKCLDDLKKYLVCELHSTSGTPVYCWIDPLGRNKEHDPLNHEDMTLWVKHIMSTLRLSQTMRLTSMQAEGKGTKYVHPNITKYDTPATKKHRTMQQAPDVHLSINITPAPGAVDSGMQTTYQISKASAPTASVVPLDTKSSSVPGPSRSFLCHNPHGS